MLSVRDSKYNEIKLIFSEEGHSYKDNVGNNYISTTTILHSYQPKFDKKMWLSKKAKELGISEKKLEKQWDNLTKEACNRGTDIHNGIEDAIKASSMFKDAVKYMRKENGEMITIADIPNITANVKPLDIKELIDATDNKYPKIYEVLNYYINNGYYIYSEIGAFMYDYLISGTIDLLCIREDQFVIGDWKTNRGGLQFEAGYYRKDKTSKPHQLTNEFVQKNETLLPPLTALPNCNGSIYNLQLSMYAYMVERVLGIPNAGLWLCHIDSDFVLNRFGMPKMFKDGTYHIKENPINKVTLYKMKYLKQEIQKILLDRKRVLLANGTMNKTLFD